MGWGYGVEKLEKWCFFFLGGDRGKRGKEGKGGEERREGERGLRNVGSSSCQSILFAGLVLGSFLRDSKENRIWTAAFS